MYFNANQQMRTRIFGHLLLATLLLAFGTNSASAQGGILGALFGKCSKADCDECGSACDDCGSLWDDYASEECGCEPACGCDDCEPVCGCDCCEPECGYDNCCEPECGIDPCGDGCDGCASQSKGGCGLLTRLREMIGMKSKSSDCDSGCCDCGCGCNGEPSAFYHGRSHGGTGSGAIHYVSPTSPQMLPKPAADTPGTIPAPVPRGQYDEPVMPDPKADESNDPFRNDPVSVRRIKVPQAKKVHVQANFEQALDSTSGTTMIQHVKHETPAARVTSSRRTLPTSSQTGSDRWTARLHVKKFDQ